MLLFTAPKRKTYNNTAKKEAAMLNHNFFKVLDVLIKDRYKEQLHRDMCGHVTEHCILNPFAPI